MRLTAAPFCERLPSGLRNPEPAVAASESGAFYALMAGVRRYKAGNRANKSACLVQVLSPRHQTGLGSSLLVSTTNQENF